MDMVLVARDRLIERGQGRVDYQVVMPGILLFDSRGGDAHAREAELHLDRARNGGPIRGRDDVDLRVFWRIGRRGGAGNGQHGGRNHGQGRKFHDTLPSFGPSIFPDRLSA
jgi:hypothetical protein